MSRYLQLLSDFYFYLRPVVLKIRQRNFLLYVALHKYINNNKYNLPVKVLPCN